MKKQCSMLKLLKFIIIGLLIFSSTLTYSQKKIQLNGKGGLGTLSGYMPSSFRFFRYSDSPSAALSYSLGVTASYKWLELELGYVQGFLNLGRNYHRNGVDVFTELPYVAFVSNELESYKNIHLLLNFKLDLNGTQIKIGGGFVRNNISNAKHRTFSFNDVGLIEEEVSEIELNQWPIQPSMKLSHVIGLYETSLTIFRQKRIYYQGKIQKHSFIQLGVSRSLFDEKKNDNLISNRKTRERILSFSPGFNRIFPLGRGLASAMSFSFEVSKPINGLWEITAGAQWPFLFFGYRRTGTDFEIDDNGHPFAINNNRLEGYAFYKLLISKIKKISDTFSFTYGLGPAINYKEPFINYRDNIVIKESVFGMTAHASLYSPGVLYRLEFNFPFGKLPSHLSFGVSLPISISKNSKENEKPPIDLDNWNI